MKAHYRAFGGRLVIEVEADTVASLFQQISPISEVLDADQCCGKCASQIIYPRARVAQEYTFYELVCGNPECGARLSFGQHKKGGTLFAKREDEQGNKLDHHGWKIYLGLPTPGKDTPRTDAPPANPPGTQGAYRRTPPSTAGKSTVDVPRDALEVTALIRRASLSAANREKVEQELCDQLRALSMDTAAGERLVQECWKAAAEPAADDDDILRRLWVIVEAQKVKKG